MMRLKDFARLRAQGESFRKDILRDESGATLVYATVIMAVAIGLTGLSLDLSAYYLTRQQAQSAADAAALAAAYQLPDKTLATQAAQTAPVTTNNAQFNKTPGAVTIASVTFYKSIPADDDDPLTDVAGPTDVARYVHVVTSQLIQRPFVLQALGLGEETFTAEATATKGEAKCNVTPLAICSPDEAGFNPANYYGKQVAVKAGGGGSWAPGNWGLLDTPGGSQSANDLADMLAGISGLPTCLNDIDGVDTKPGNVSRVRTAFNVRLDMYENPGYKGESGNPNFPPAENVAKGISPDNPSCNKYSKTPWDTKMPRDTNIDVGNDQRFGNGDWDCQYYWTQNHPGDPTLLDAPAGCGPAGSNTATRYDTYLHEVTTSNIPNTTGHSPVGDNGNPVCYTGTVPPTPTAPADRINDRRIFTIAVINCNEYGVAGNSSNVPVEYYLSAFMTEAVGDPPNDDLYLEIVGSSASGGSGAVPVRLNKWVELVR